MSLIYAEYSKKQILFPFFSCCACQRRVRIYIYVDNSGFNVNVWQDFNYMEDFTS